MINRLLSIFFFCSVSLCIAQNSTQAEKLAQGLLESVKRDQISAQDSLLNLLSTLASKTLFIQLDSDAKKKSFWINVYNATTQLILKKDTTVYTNRNRFYAKRWITVAGEALSLDEIEHGILRKNRSKLSLGYFRKLKSTAFIRSAMVSEIDYRIHFALNCGAKSCPPILFYHAEKLEEELELATFNYLQQECERRVEQIIIPKLFRWFRADFGGKQGIYSILKKYDVIPQNEKPKIRYKAYDWALHLGI